MEKVNIRGSINKLVKNSKTSFRKDEHKVSSIRSIAGNLTADAGKKFKVSVNDGTITVKRIS